MGSPCPPCKRLRGANLELLPHVNNLLGSFFGGGERGTHELFKGLQPVPSVSGDYCRLIEHVKVR